MVSNRLFRPELFTYSVCIGMISRNSLLKPKEIFLERKSSFANYIINKRKHFTSARQYQLARSNQKAAQPLLKNGSVTKQYVEAMVQSVLDAGPYIVLMPGFALAHARSEDGVCRLGLSAMTLNTPSHLVRPMIQ